MSFRHRTHLMNHRLVNGHESCTERRRTVIHIQGKVPSEHLTTHSIGHTRIFPFLDEHITYAPSPALPSSSTFLRDLSKKLSTKSPLLRLLLHFKYSAFRDLPPRSIAFSRCCSMSPSPPSSPSWSQPVLGTSFPPLRIEHADTTCLVLTTYLYSPIGERPGDVAVAERSPDSFEARVVSSRSYDR